MDPSDYLGPPLLLKDSYRMYISHKNGLIRLSNDKRTFLELVYTSFRPQ